jgi:hypothetical protein
MADLGVHDARFGRSRRPIPVFTMRRFERSRCPDPGVHDRPISALRNVCTESTTTLDLATQPRSRGRRISRAPAPHNVRGLTCGRNQTITTRRAAQPLPSRSSRQRATTFIRSTRQVQTGVGQEHRISSLHQSRTARRFALRNLQHLSAVPTLQPREQRTTSSAGVPRSQQPSSSTLQLAIASTSPNAPAPSAATLPQSFIPSRQASPASRRSTHLSFVTSLIARHNLRARLRGGLPQPFRSTRSQLTPRRVQPACRHPRPRQPQSEARRSRPAALALPLRTLPQTNSRARPRARDSLLARCPTIWVSAAGAIRPSRGDGRQDRSRGIRPRLRSGDFTGRKPVSCKP